MVQVPLYGHVPDPFLWHGMGSFQHKTTTPATPGSFCYLCSAPHSCSSPTALPTSPSLLLLLLPLLLLHPNSSFPIQTDSIQLLVVVYSSIDYWWVSSGACFLVATCWLTCPLPLCHSHFSFLQTALITELMTATEAVPSHSYWHYINLNKLHMRNLKLTPTTYAHAYDVRQYIISYITSVRGSLTLTPVGSEK